jgi:hypothetical protein
MTNEASTTTQATQTQEQPPIQQSDVVDRFLDSPLPEAEMRTALANGVPPVHATCRLHIFSLIRVMGAMGPQKAFDFAASTIRERDPKGNLDYHCALARAAVKRVECDFAKMQAEELLRQFPQYQEPLQHWDKLLEKRYAR